ncbi:MAG: hypothetical protein IPH54_21445 [Rhodoferax sp.]|nr:hypothetical protein [Rhodoferax sp.]
MGLTPIRTWSYYWVSQVGMLAGTLVYVNAGTQLDQITSLSGIVSPGVAVVRAARGVSHAGQEVPGLFAKPPGLRQMAAAQII